MTEKPYRRSPAPPFMTSTLQQEASRKLRFGAQRTMQVAQRLYEQGWITYMRTDSTTLSDEALTAARAQASALYGREYVPDAPRRYERKVKNAQEAHEAIRPAGESFRTPDEAGRRAQRGRAPPLRPDLEAHGGLADGRRHRDQRPGPPGGRARRAGTAGRRGGVLGVGHGHQVRRVPAGLRRGIRRPRGRDWPSATSSSRRWPRATPCRPRTSRPRSHTTQPPARYTEASLVKALEELGVGRPSTYASILGTIQNRGYVWKKGTALVPSFTAFAVVGLLERYFGELVDYGFTAAMEDDLDEIAEGAQEVLPWLDTVLFRRRTGSARGHPAGCEDGPMAPTADSAAASRTTWRRTSARSTPARSTRSPSATDAEGEPIVVRVGRYGPYLQRGEDRASIPEDLPPDELTVERAEELLAAPSGDRALGTDPDSGLPVLVRSGRFGPYVQLGEAVDGGDQPRTASLFKIDDARDRHPRPGARAAAPAPDRRHRPRVG